MKFECLPYLNEETTKELLLRLSKIEGQIRGISRMIEEKRSCDDILIQITAAKSALDGLAIKLLEEHIEQCIKPSVCEGHTESLEHFVKALKKIMKGGSLK